MNEKSSFESTLDEISSLDSKRQKMVWMRRSKINGII